MIELVSNPNQRTYFISSCSNLLEVKANSTTARDILDVFCTVIASKDYTESSLIKVENHRISSDLLDKVLTRTLSKTVKFTEEESKVLKPFSQKLKRFCISE